MAFANPQFRISRRPVVTQVNEWVKMFDPPTASPATPERIDATNPVPEVMLAGGFQNKVSTPHTVRRELLKGLDVNTFDGARIRCFTLGDPDNPTASGGNFPAATIRVPRGVLFHGQTEGKGPPPHTIHWHGIEPTPINDGVGHCSMEVGTYLYQWQPNFMGQYFYHCHRNTVQHFEFGLYGLLLVETPDAFFASLNSNGTLNSIPIGAGSDGKRRAAANTAAFPQFPGFNNLALTSGDPHAFTVPYDVEAIWVLQGLDSVWHSVASDAKDFFPSHGNNPGFDDNFPQGFFHDYNPDYFFVTGVNAPVHVLPGALAPTTALPGGLIIPPGLNSGVSGSQISVNASVGQTILVRVLDAAYAKVKITFPVNAVIIAWDGRALGVPPYASYNNAYLVPAGTPIEFSTARRFDALLRPTAPINSFATAQLIQQRDAKTPLVNIQIPFIVN
jgi:hypothetical protein